MLALLYWLVCLRLQVEEEPATCLLDDTLINSYKTVANGEWLNPTKHTYFSRIFMELRHYEQFIRSDIRIT